MTVRDKPTVLFIDDHLANLDAFSRLMRANKIDVIGVNNLHTALDAIKKTPIDLIICDINLNASNPNDRAGVQIAEFARRTQPGVPIVAHTAFFASDDFSDYEKSLFAKLYAKASSSPDDLVRRIKELRKLALQHRTSVTHTRKTRRTKDRYDVFLCHNSSDKPAVKRLAKLLVERGIRPWFDEWELVPGRPWQEALEAKIATIGCAAVLVGKSGIGPWANREMRAFLSEFVRRNIALIPVMLPGSPSAPELPVFLKEFTWVDLRDGIRKTGVDQLIWGITGRKP